MPKKKSKKEKRSSEENLLYRKILLLKKVLEKKSEWATKVLTFVNYVVNNSIPVHLCTFT